MNLTEKNIRKEVFSLISKEEFDELKKIQKKMIQLFIMVLGGLA